MSQTTTGPRRPTSTGPLSAPQRVLRGAGRPGAWAASMVLVAAVAMLLGVGLGRVFPAPVGADAAVLLERDVVPLAVDADGLWTAGVGELPPVSEHLSQLRREGVNPDIAEFAQPWGEALDGIVRRMVGVEVPAIGRPAQRQFVQAVTLSRDALDVMVEAAATDDPQQRRDLSSEALRLRTRAEQATQMARASLSDLRGGGSGVAEPATLPSLSELR